MASAALSAATATILTVEVVRFQVMPLNDPGQKKEGKSSRPFCRWHSYPHRYPPCRGGIGSAGLYFLFLPWAETSDGLDQLLYLRKPALQKRELEFQPFQAQLVNADPALPGLVFNLMGNANHSGGGDLS